MPALTAPAPVRVTTLPSARGPLSAALLDVLVGVAPATSQSGLPVADADPYGEDLQLALYLGYELHYRPLPGVDPELEWDPALLALRRELETVFLAALRRDVEPGDDVEEALAPMLLVPVTGRGTFEQLREYVAHRSIYHLKEADPQGWVIPRLEGQCKAAFAAVQHDEYGAGRAERMHAQLFVETMRELELDASYGAFLDRAPATTLAPVNLMSLTGLRRTLLGAAVGHMVMIEVTSSPGSRRLSSAFVRLDAGDAGRRFYDEHVEADAVHEQVLRAGLQDLLERTPEVAADVVFGLRASLLLEDRFSDSIVDAWEAGRTSLLRPLD